MSVIHSNEAMPIPAPVPAKEAAKGDNKEVKELEHTDVNEVKKTVNTDNEEMNKVENTDDSEVNKIENTNSKEVKKVENINDKGVESVGNSETVGNKTKKKEVVFHTPENMSSSVKYNLSSIEATVDHPLSEISMKDFDLELPPIDSIKCEPVDFPNSPQELRQTYEASGVRMPQETSSRGKRFSEEDDDHSMYQAVLSPDCQDIKGRRDKLESLPGSAGRRKIIPVGKPVKLDQLDNISLDSQLSDEDFDQMLSPGLESPDEMEDSILEQLDDSPVSKSELIPELTAREELEESRSWQQCMVGGIDRQIDMKVIEPYKRVLSHGGYLSVGSHNAIIVFSACFLPHRSRTDYNYVMDNLFFYVLKTLDQLVTEDYVLIYLHGATARDCMPTFSWLKRCYQMIDRRLRKNLKNLYLVHPTFWLKTIVLMTKPFISSKFSKKLVFINSLAELYETLPLEEASVPERVKQYDRIKLSLESK